MEKRMIKVLLGLSGLIVLVIALFLSGCSLKSPLMSNIENNDLEAILSVDQAKEAITNGLAKPDDDVYMICYAEARAEFDRGGGELRIQLDNQDIFFIVPAGAFRDDNDGNGYEIHVWGEKWNTGSGLVFSYDCSPEGMVFAEPIILRQPLGNVEEGNENLFWKDTATGEWIVEDHSRIVSGVIEFEINHFSNYAISD